MCLFQNIPAMYFGQKEKKKAWREWSEQTNRDTTCCTSRVSSVIRYCTSLSSKICCTVNTMNYYYSDESEKQLCSVEFRADGLPRTSVRRWHSDGKNRRTGFLNLRIFFFFFFFFSWTAWFITGRWFGGASGDGHKVTDTLLGSAWDERSSAQCWLTLTHTTRGSRLRVPGNALKVALPLHSVKWCHYQCFK